jgi:ribonuclease P protein component
VPARSVGRIQTRAAFRQLQRSRSRGSSGAVRATFVAADESVAGVFPQVAYAIGRNCGNAVTRNRLRRRLRAAVQDTVNEIPRGSYLVRTDPSATTLSMGDLAADLTQALQKAAHRGTGR